MKTDIIPELGLIISLAFIMFTLFFGQACIINTRLLPSFSWDRTVYWVFYLFLFLIF
jgi:hypothetical protein